MESTDKMLYDLFSTAAFQAILGHKDEEKSKIELSKFDLNRLQDVKDACDVLSKLIKDMLERETLS